MSDYKLIYFNSRGYAEPIRILLHLSGAQFSDVRVERDSYELKEVLRMSPGGVIPSLVFGGLTYCQSVPLTRYVGKLGGFCGDTLEENLKIDMFVAHLYDLIARYDDVVYEVDLRKKAKKKDAAFAGYFKVYLAQLENMVCAEGPFIIGSKMTWGDILMMSFLELKQTSKYGSTTVLDDFPRLQNLYAAVRRHDGVASWLKVRPITEK